LFIYNQINPKLTFLDKYNDDETWNKFEKANNQQLVNVCNLDLEAEPIVWMP